MRVRSFRSLAVVSACAILPVACTSILGDYTIGSAGPTSDDGSMGTDGLVAADVIGTDQVTTDAPADAGPDAAGFAKLACVEVGSSRFVVGTVPNGGSPSQPLLFGRPSNTMRALVSDGSVTHTFTFQTGGGSHNVQDAVLNTGHVFAAKSYPGGIVALFDGSVPVDGGGSTQAILISKLADGSLTWSAPLAVTDPGEMDCTNRRGATFQVIDAAMDEYLLAFSYTAQTGPGCAGGNPRVFGRHIKGSTGTSHEWAFPPSDLPDDAGGQGGLDFPSDGIAVVGTDVFVIANAGGGGGPNGGGPTLFKSTLPMTSATLSSFALKVPTDFMESVGIAPGLTAATANLGFLEADINSGTSLPEMYIGQTTGPALTTLNPSASLGVTTLAGLNDLIVDKSTYHWNDFTTGGGSENLLGIGPRVNSHIGVNFLWWDAKGRVRAQHTGAGDLLHGEFVYGADIAFNQAPFTVLADFELVFMKDDPDAGANAIDVIAADIACVKP